MDITYRKIIFTDQKQIHFGSKFQLEPLGLGKEYKPICPVLQCTYDNDNKVMYFSTGFLDSFECFVNCSIIYKNIIIFNFTLLLIAELDASSKIIHKEVTRFKLHAFDKDIFVNSELQIEVKKYQHYILMLYPTESLTLITDTINFMNDYLANSGVITDLDLSKLSYNTFEPDTRNSILSIINGLSIQHFENSRNIPGKDNVFWDEFEITDLPRYSFNSYFLPIIQNILIKNFRSVTKTDDRILVMGESDSGWSPSFARRSVDRDATYVKTILAFEIPKYLKQQDIVVYKLQRQYAL